MRSHVASTAGETGAVRRAPLGDRLRRRVRALFDRRRRLLLDVADVPAEGVSGGIGRAVRELTRHLTLSAGADLLVRPVRTAGAGFRSAEDFSAALFGGAPPLGAPERIRAGRGDRVLMLGLDRSAFHLPWTTSWPASAARAHAVARSSLSSTICIRSTIPGATASRRVRRATSPDGSPRSAGSATGSSVTPGRRGTGWRNGSRRTRPSGGAPFRSATSISERMARGPRPSPARPGDRRAGPARRARPLDPHGRADLSFQGTRAGPGRLRAALERGRRPALVAVGDAGDPDSALRTRIENHAERDRRLFWFPQLSGGALLRLYRESSALLNASLAEGFGLPALEAAREGLPLILRDIPIHRETVGSDALYFSGERAESHRRPRDGRAGARESLSPSTALRLTWAESAARLRRLLEDREWSGRWTPREGVV